MTRRLVLAFLLFIVASPPVAAEGTGPITPAGQELAAFLNGMDVEHLWLARATVDWKTGEPDGRMTGLPHGHTHCSAFVAATAERLGVYILRPPEHSAKLLANAQDEWLHRDAGRAAGWRRVGSLSDPEAAVTAVAAANRGELVVAIYHASRRGHPGHIAIVRPSAKSDTLIAREGPDVIQAGLTNYRLTSLRQGFAEHPPAWRDGTIEFFVHATKFSNP